MQSMWKRIITRRGRQPGHFRKNVSGVLLTKSLTNDSRRGRCLIELSFLKAHRETYLQLEPVDGDNSFVIIEQDDQLQEDTQPCI